MIHGLRIEVCDIMADGRVMGYEYRVTFFKGKERYEGTGTACCAVLCFDKAMEYIEEVEHA